MESVCGADNLKDKLDLKRPRNKHDKVVVVQTEEGGPGTK